MRLIVWAFKAVILLLFFSVLWVAIYAAVPVPVSAATARSVAEGAWSPTRSPDLLLPFPR